MSGKWCFLGPRLNEVLGKGKGKIIHHGMRETVSRWEWPQGASSWEVRRNLDSAVTESGV